jgi:hypothetical protein
MIRRFALVLAAAVFGLAATPGNAQGFGFSFGHHGRHSSVGFGFNTGGHYGHGHRYHRPRRVWTPGYYETVAQQVWVPGATRRVWCEPVYDTCHEYGRPVRRCVTAGYWRTIQDQGCYQTRYVRVWRDGCWR